MTFDRRETAILLIGDFLILVASLWAALSIRNLGIPEVGYFFDNLIPFSPMFFLSLGIFFIAGLYEKQTRPIRRIMGVRILGAQAATVAIGAILFFTLPLPIAPKTILVLYLAVSVAAESFWRFSRMKHEIKAEKRVPALLVGKGAAVSELHDEINGNDHRYLLRFSQHLIPASGTVREIEDAVASGVKGGVRVVVLDRMDSLVAQAAPSLYSRFSDEVHFVDFAVFYEEIFDRVPLAHLDAAQLLSTVPQRRALYDTSKRAFDVVFSAVLSVIALPFIAAAAFLLSLSGGTPFLRNDRIGRGGRPFKIVKLRSMLFNDHGDPELQKQNRVTTLGRFLRKTRIDELPQLWNILAGDLSFIGPRPELPKLAEVYEREIPQYRIRHLITPGLSGWAQIHDYDAPRGGADVERTKKKLSLDLYYLKHRSLGLDFTITAKTLRALLSFSGT